MIFVFFDLVEIDLVAGLILISAMCTALIAGISFHEFSRVRRAWRSCRGGWE
jgi:hypothetical protein